MRLPTERPPNELILGGGRPPYGPASLLLPALSLQETWATMRASLGAAVGSYEPALASLQLGKRLANLSEKASSRLSSFRRRVGAPPADAASGER